MMNPARLLLSAVVAPALAFAAVIGPPAPRVERAGQAGQVRVWEDTLIVPTYEEGLPDPNPPFDLFAANRYNYPYTMRTNLTSTRTPRSWRTLNLENEYLSCTVLPDLGGHLYRCVDAINGADLFYANPSIKFAQIAYRGAWTALGIEFNFPVSHNWMTASPVDFAMTRRPDGSASVWVGNIDRPYGMQWRVELTLRPGRAALEQRTTLYNRSLTRQRFYWWTNAGVEVWDDSRIFYPMTHTASHGFADVDTWPVDRSGVDLSVVGNHRAGPVSRFAHGSREPFMAVYHPKTRAGVVHYAEPSDLPAKKIWSWGSDADGLDWRRALSDDNSAYVEVQAGLFRDQETYGLLEPQESARFTEHWIPVRAIDGVTRANPDAVLHLVRAPGAGSDALEVRLNVTSALPGARLTVADGARALATDAVNLAPEQAHVKSVAAVPAGRPATVSLRDRDGRLVIEHTEGRFDVEPASEVKTGPQRAAAAPPAERRSDGDDLVLGTREEEDGRKLAALEVYRHGLTRFPDSIGLLLAAGRLEVGLKQYEAALPRLTRVLERESHNREAAYYLGLARLARGDTGHALAALETGQLYGTFRPAATFLLAAHAARAGRRHEALSLLARMTDEAPAAVRGGSARVALLRALGRTDDARREVMTWLSADPTNSMLKVEAARLGMPADEVWPHLAGDPERIIEIVVDDIAFGLYEDAIDLLSREYPKGPGVVSEPGMPRPEAYPLLAYYRGYCRHLMGQPARPDFDAASKMPTAYVFPNRPETMPVLEEAVCQNPADATAHFLLGSLRLSAGLADAAMTSWEEARRLNPAIPVLHRNMGYTILHTGGPPDRAVAIFREGLTHDPRNVGVYAGLDRALTLAKRPAAERAQALLSFPDQAKLPASLVYRLATALAETGRFDEAEKQFAGRFFPREEGGVNVRGVWVAVRLLRAVALAEQKQCARARSIVDGVGREAPGLAFTKDGLDPFVRSAQSRELVARVAASCGPGR